jgi:hypothetical protein
LNRSHPKPNNHTTINAAREGESFIHAWRWWLPPALLAFTLTLLFLDPFIGDWDGFDYTVLALRAMPSSMALGRSAFIFFNHALWLMAHTAFHLPPEKAYLVFKYAVVAQCPLAVVACWQLARDVAYSIYTATIAALIVAVSPIFILYSGQVMTDVPSLMLLALALIIHLRGVRERKIWLILVGAVLLGVGVNVRETVGFYAPWLIVAPFVCGWRFTWREMATTLLACLIFLVFAFAPFAYFFVTNTDGYRALWYGWRASMREESMRHPVSLRNLLPFIVYFFAVAPLVLVSLPLAIYKEWRARKASVMLALAGVGLCANLLLFFNYSTSVNWRYFLTGFPALAPLTADYLVRAQTVKLKSVQRGFWSVVACILSVALLCAIYLKPISREHILKRALTKGYKSRLALVPDDAVMMSGAQTVAVTYWRGLGAGHWETIGTGGGWPGAEIASVVENYLRSGRRVFLDADPRWWMPCGWQSGETREIVRLESRFRFRRVGDTIYEIKLPDDDNAHDKPDLQRLLPENRASEMKKCGQFERPI